MAKRPDVVTMTYNVADILNAIRNGASVDYRNYVPVAVDNADSVKEIGATILALPALQNEFVNSLVNRIGRVLITSRLYENPLRMFKKGILELGEVVEDIFVRLAEPFTYDAEKAETELYKRVAPDIKTAFHIVNFKKFYKVTVERQQLELAFISYEGVGNLITKIIEQLYTAMNYDEFPVTKYMLAKNILDGKVKAITVTDDPKAVVSAIKGVSNKFTFLSPDYNLVGVENYSDKTSQYLITNSDFDAVMDVEVLASAFNMDKAEFMGRRVLIDSLGALDIARLEKLLGDEVDISTDELEALRAIPAVLLDENYFMIFDKLIEMRDAENGQGLYWNYMLHNWKIFSTSPFAPVCVFVPEVPIVTGVSITPSEATVARGGSTNLTANVDTENFAPKSVTWTSDTEGVTVSASGVVTVGADVEQGTQATITATSTFDAEQSATATITVA